MFYSTVFRCFHIRSYCVAFLFCALFFWRGSEVFAQQPPVRTDVPLSEAGVQADALPSFPGGSEVLAEYMKKNIIFPEAARGKTIQGVVILTFDVAEDGKIGAVAVVRGLDPDVDAEAVRMVQAMPLWVPGRQGGKAVKIPVNLPVRFQAFAQEAQNMPVPAQRPAATPNTNASRNVIDVMPQFPGGQSALLSFMRTNLTYPAADRDARIQGVVTLAFVVDVDGSISNIRVLRSLSQLCDAEAMRMVRIMPKWTPGKLDGKPVKVQFTLPVRFSVM